MFSVARQYKGFDAITIAGGSHVDALPQEALFSGIDIVVHGEGEETIIELLTRISGQWRCCPQTGPDRLPFRGLAFLMKKDPMYLLAGASLWAI